MNPELNLSYSSAGETGAAGVGWNIGGVSSIERCGTTVATDGRTGTVRFADDKLCLNGQRLVLVNGDINSDAAYWSDTAEYRTEVETFVRVKAQGTGAQRSFEVETRDGELQTYGGTADSFAKAIGRADGQAYAWKLNQRRDHSGNYVSYSYSNNAVSGEIKLQEVSWGGNATANKPHYARVHFNYEQRPDARDSYIAGSPAFDYFRLKDIRTYTTSDSAAEVVGPSYTLAYEISESSSRSLLKTVTMCFSSGACMPATSFESGRPATGSRTFTQLGNDRVGPNLGMLGAAPEMPGYAVDQSRLAMDSVAVGDFNNDGKTDLLERYRTAANGYRQRLYESSPDGTSWIISTPFQAGVDLTVMESGDFDGDGLTDVLVASYDRSNNRQTNWRICWGRLRTAAGFDCNASVTLPEKATNFGWLNGPPSNARMVVDLDNDGRDDLILRGKFVTEPVTLRDRQSLFQCKSNGTSFDCTDVTFSGLGTHFAVDENRINWAGSVYADMDADGRTDRIIFDRCKMVHVPEERGFVWACQAYDEFYDYGAIHINTINEIGASAMSGEWFRFPNKRMRIYAPLETGTLTADLNNDGYTDVAFGSIQLSTSNSLAALAGHLCYSKGNGEGDCRPMPSSGTVNGVDVDPFVMMVADFDGDGVVDILRPNVYAWAVDNVPGYRLCHVNGTASAQYCTDWTGPTFYVTNGKALDLGARSNQVAATRSMFLGDLNGDGKPDIVTYVGGDTWRVHGAATQAQDGLPLDRLVSVTNGYGYQERVEYGTANDSQLYSPAADDIDGNPIRVGKRIYPTTPLVRLLRKDDGAGGWRDTRFDYAALARDQRGRGGLGFGRVRRTDEHTKITTTQWRNQVYPNVGAVLAETQTTSTGIRLSVRKDLSASRNITQANGTASRFPYVSTSESARRDLDDTEISNEIAVNSVPDAWGNVATSTVSRWVGASYLGSSRTTVFDNTEASWLIGKPRTVTETRTGNGLESSRTTDYTYDDKGRLKTVQNAKGNALLNLEVTYVLDGFGNIESVNQRWTEPATQALAERRILLTGYDTKGRFGTSVTDALGRKQTFEFDPVTGAKVSHIDSNGIATTWKADSFGRESMVRQQDGNEGWVRQLSCSASCPPEAATVTIRETMRNDGTERTSAPVLTFNDRAGHALRSVSYSLDGRMTATDVRYDQRGRPTHYYWPRFVSADDVGASASGAPSGATLQKELIYDRLDRIIQTNTLDEQGAEQRSKIDYMGAALVQTNALNRTHREERDAWGRLILVRDAAGYETNYTYDGWNNLATVTDPQGNVTQIVYDGLGRKTELIDPDLGHIQYSVDPVGRTWKQVSPNQRNHSATAGTRFTYDIVDRLIERTEQDLAARWIYDMDGATDCVQTKSCGKLVEAYTLAGSERDARRIYSYDSWGRPSAVTSIVGGQKFVSARDYDAWGRESAERHLRGSGVQREFTRRYNNMGQLERIEGHGKVLWRATAQTASGVLAAASLGNGLQVVREYNPMTGRLSAATLANGAGAEQLREGYGYDAVGNVSQRTQYWPGTGFIEDFKYDSMNRLEKPVSELGVQLRSDGTTIYYAGAMELEVNGNVQRSKTYWPMGLGVTIEQGADVQLNWIHADRLGSVVAITGTDGVLREKFSYDSWGKRRALNGSPSNDQGLKGGTDNRGYTGHEMLDQVGLVHMNGRIYLPEIARFTSADPIIQDPTHSQSYNRYTYVWNNPTNSTDPTGFVKFGVDPHDDQTPSDNPHKRKEEDEARRCGEDMKTKCVGFRNSATTQNGNSEKNSANSDKPQQAAGCGQCNRLPGDFGKEEKGPVPQEGVTSICPECYLIGAGGILRGVASRLGLMEAEAVAGQTTAKVVISGAEEQAAKGLVQNPMFKDAVSQFKNTDLTNAGRALFKHPEVIGETKESLRQVLRTDSALNDAAATSLKDIMRNGTRFESNLPRYGNTVTYQLPGGFGARFEAVTNKFIGFINP